MITEYFGLTVGNFVKMMILIAFLFFFIRMVHLMILFADEEKTRKDLTKMFYLTEFLVWLIFAIWIFYMVPFHKLELLLILVLFNFANAWFWTKIKESVARYFIIKIQNLNTKTAVKLNNEVFFIDKFEPEKISLKNKISTLKIKYTDFLKKDKKIAYSETFDIDKKNSHLDKEKLSDILNENGFINYNTFVEINENNEKINIKVKSFDKKQLDRTKHFIEEIL